VIAAQSRRWPRTAQGHRAVTRSDTVGGGRGRTHDIPLFFMPSACEDQRMTTRQCLNTGFYRGGLWFIAALFGLGVLQYGALGKAVNGAPIKVTSVLIFLGMLYYRWLAPCLNCRKSLKWFALSWRPAAFATTSPRCSYCDVSIDHETMLQR
jgi:hypothetical protein